jgi:hypothetical protein
MNMRRKVVVRKGESVTGKVAVFGGNKIKNGDFAAFLVLTARNVHYICSCTNDIFLAFENWL